MSPKKPRSLVVEDAWNSVEVPSSDVAEHLNGLRMKGAKQDSIHIVANHSQMNTTTIYFYYNTR